MLKHALSIPLTAACCFGIAAATGLGASSTKIVTLKVGEVASFAPDNFDCQVITSQQVACGTRLEPNAVLTYFAPHELEVIKLPPSGNKAEILFAAKR